MQSLSRAYFWLKHGILWTIGHIYLIYYQFAPLSMIRIEDVRRHYHYMSANALGYLAFRLADTMVGRDENADEYYFLRSLAFCRNGQLEDGFEDISEALNIAPRNTTYWLFRAKVYRAMHLHESAISDLQQSIHYYKKGHPAIQWFEIGINYMQMAQNESALTALKEAVKETELVVPVYYYRMAQVYDRLDDALQAQQFLQKSVEMNFLVEEQLLRAELTVYDRSEYTVQEITDLLIEVYELGLFVPSLCRFLYMEEKLAEALELLNRALAVLPNQHRLLIERGKCYRLMGEYGFAMQDFDAAYEQGDELEIVLVERGHLHRVMGNEALALDDFLRAKSLDEQFPYLDYWISGSYVVLERFEEALKSFEDALAFDDQDVDCYLERAEIHEAMGSFVEAERDYDKAIEIVDNEDTRMKRGLFRWRMDLHDDALQDVQKALEMNESLRDNSQFCYIRGMLFLELEHFGLADEDLSRAIQFDSESEILFEKRAKCRTQLERYEDAIMDCDAGLQLNPTHDALLWMRGYLHYQVGDYRAAIRDSMAYMKVNPDDHTVHFNLALIYIRLMDYKNALAQLTLAIAKDAGHVEAYYQRALVWEKLLDFDKTALDLANWAFYDRSERSFEQRLERLQQLEEFDEMIVEDAVKQLKKLYGQDDSKWLH